MLLAALLARERATGILAIIATTRAATCARGAIDKISTVVAGTTLIPAVAQTLNVVALVSRVVARLVAVVLQIQSVVPAGEDEFLKVTHDSLGAKGFDDFELKDFG